MDKQENNALGAEDETLKKLEGWGKGLDSHWGDWLTEASRCFDLVANNQWSAADKGEMEDDGKVPVTFNRIGPVIDAVCGSEILSRQEVSYSPRTLGDTGVNEILTRGAEWIRDRSDAKGEESDAVRDTFICGLGYTETRLDYEENPKGKIIIERGPAMKCLPDPRARKANAIDARYLRYRNEMSRDEFEEMYPDEAATYDPVEGKTTTSNDPRDDYDADEKQKDENTVTVDLWQWYERRRVYIMKSMDGTRTVEFPEEAFQQLKEAAEAEGRPMPRYGTRWKRFYFEAILTGCRWLQEPKELPHAKFRFKFMTGKRDNEKGVWFGLVRPMEDPQRWTNELYSMALHIMRTNAKGGLIIEKGAAGGNGENPIADQKRFEESWAKSNALTWVEEGALSGDRIRPKTPPPMPPALASLFEQAVVAIRETSGVSQEMMGLVEHNQPGVVEHQRKQSGFAILATFFDSFRRYRQFQGELMLPMMRDLGPETLVRIVGEDGNPKYAQLAMDPDVQEYDVIVSDAPAGPNQKERNWQLFMQILPAVKDMMTPEVWLEVLRYSPFPEAFVNKLTQMLTQGSDDQKAQVMEQLKMGMLQLQGQEKQADIREKHARASATEVKTQLAIVRPDPSPQVAI
jgi:hypothetical protein